MCYSECPVFSETECKNVCLDVHLDWLLTVCWLRLNGLFRLQGPERGTIDSTFLWCHVSTRAALNFQQEHVVRVNAASAGFPAVARVNAASAGFPAVARVNAASAEFPAVIVVRVNARCTEFPAGSCCACQRARR